jgi:hypothetical protein
MLQALLLSLISCQHSGDLLDAIIASQAMHVSYGALVTSFFCHSDMIIPMNRQCRKVGNTNHLSMVCK